jgi:hypothetical protein
MQTFASDVERIVAQADMFIPAFGALHECDLLNVSLLRILTLGNVLNNGSAMGLAAG